MTILGDGDHKSPQSLVTGHPLAPENDFQILFHNEPK